MQGFTPIEQGVGPFLSHLVLPALALGLVYMALLARMTRSTMLEVLGEDYIRTARAKGLSENKVVWKHAFRNSLIPIITIFASLLPAAISGAFVIEIIFTCCVQRIRRLRLGR